MIGFDVTAHCCRFGPRIVSCVISNSLSIRHCIWLLRRVIVAFLSLAERLDLGVDRFYMGRKLADLGC